jgi:hypothetical protein
VALLVVSDIYCLVIFLFVALTIVFQCVARFRMSQSLECSRYDPMGDR